jgi:glucokinase
VQHGDRLEAIDRETTGARRVHDLPDALADFLARSREAPAAACVAVPGPVIDGRVQSNTLPLSVAESELRSVVGNLRVVDQAAAAAAGVGRLRDGDLVALQSGAPSPRGTIGVAYVGSAFSFAVMLRGASRFRVLHSATGEADFAPRGVVERALATHLEKRAGRASLNQILTARGLHTLLDFLASSMQPLGAEAELARNEDDPWAVIRLALEGRDNACVQALAAWATILGEECRNAALRTLPSGGLYVAGTAVARTVRALRSGSFRDGFTGEGPMRPLLETVPVHAVVEPRLPLIGAAHAAFLALDGRWPL